jgi:hypothetical protein
LSISSQNIKISVESAGKLLFQNDRQLPIYS